MTSPFARTYASSSGLMLAASTTEAPQSNNVVDVVRILKNEHVFPLLLESMLLCEHRILARFEEMIDRRPANDSSVYGAHGLLLHQVLASLTTHTSR